MYKIRECYKCSAFNQDIVDSCTRKNAAENNFNRQTNTILVKQPTVNSRRG